MTHSSRVKGEAHPGGSREDSHPSFPPKKSHGHDHPEPLPVRRKQRPHRSGLHPAGPPVPRLTDINVPDKAVSDQSPSRDNHPAMINQLFVELFFICSVMEKHNFEINKINILLQINMYFDKHHINNSSHRFRYSLVSKYLRQRFMFTCILVIN